MATEEKPYSIEVEEKSQTLFLTDLPAELLTEIANDLSAFDKACFALTCMHLNSITYPAKFTAEGFSKRNARDRERLSKLLAKDSPDHILCKHCKKLHKIDNPEKLATRFNVHPNPTAIRCAQIDWRDRSSSFHGTNIPTSLYRMFLKRYAQERFEEAHEILNAASSVDYVERVDGLEATLFTHKVVDGLLLQRREYVFIPWFLPGLRSGVTSGHELEVCAHHKASFFHDQEGTRLVIGGSWIKQYPQSHTLRTIKCNKCAVQAGVYVKFDPELGDIVLKTTWGLIGAVQNTFNDAEPVWSEKPWEIYCDSSTFLWYRDGCPIKDIAELFEGADKGSWDKNCLRYKTLLGRSDNLRTESLKEHRASAALWDVRKRVTPSAYNLDR